MILDGKRRKPLVDAFYYKEIFFGSIDASDRYINRLIREAEDNIKASTLGRGVYDALEEEEEDVKRAICYEVEAIHALKEITGGGLAGSIKSYSIDGVSVSMNEELINRASRGQVLSNKALDILNRTSLRDRRL